MWHVPGDMWQVICDWWQVTRDTWLMVWGEHFLKMSALRLSRFGSYDVLKIWRKRITELISKRMTKVFVEQPRLHRVCNIWLLEPWTWKIFRYNIQLQLQLQLQYTTRATTTDTINEYSCRDSYNIRLWQPVTAKIYNKHTGAVCN